MAEHVDRVNSGKIPGVRCTLRANALRLVPCRKITPVTGSCLQRARGHTAGVDGRQLKSIPASSFRLSSEKLPLLKVQIMLLRCLFQLDRES